MGNCCRAYDEEQTLLTRDYMQDKHNKDFAKILVEKIIATTVQSGSQAYYRFSIGHFDQEKETIHVNQYDRSLIDCRGRFYSRLKDFTTHEFIDKEFKARAIKWRVVIFLDTAEIICTLRRNVEIEHIMM